MADTLNDLASNELLGKLSDEIQGRFVEKRSVMSFAEFFEEFRSHPRRHARNVSQYILDMFEHFGHREIDTPRGKVRRYNVFDLEMTDGRERVVGQESAQHDFVQAIANFVRQRRPNRMLLFHGPNGSAKSSFINCIVRGLEHYSHLDEGSLYRFNWVFPTQKLSRSSIGFEGHGTDKGSSLPTYAHLEELEIDAKLIEEMRDNPLFLIPLDARQRLLLELFGEASRDPEKADENQFVLSDYIFDGALSHKSRRIFDALLGSYSGDYKEVLKHVQIERFYISRRYRQAAVSVEPQLRADAGSRQVTADRSLSALPTSLQNQTLFEPHGDLVDGNRGVVEFNDLLKRHPDLNKYLIGTIERGLVNVEHAILYIDSVMVGSVNEEFLEAFKAQPEYPSFKGRMQLIRMPYLLDYETEKLIYDQMFKTTEFPLPVGPHTTFVAALWAVLTRLDKPDPQGYDESIRDIIEELSPLEKAELYTRGRVPEGSTSDQARQLRAAISEIILEGATRPLHYEGRYGVSPREMKATLLRAAQRGDRKCFGPLAVFEELRELVRDPSVYPFLRIKADGAYHDHPALIDVVVDRYVDIVDNEVRNSLGLVDAESYETYFSRYVTTINHFLKGEKMLSKHTGSYEDASDSFMTEVEKSLGVSGDPRDFRNDIISAVAAYSIDNPETQLRYREIFPELFMALEDAYFSERRVQVERIEKNLLRYIGGDDGLEEDERTQVETALENMRTRFGYSEECAHEAIGFLMRMRYSE